MSCNTAGMLSLFYYIKIAMNIIFIGAPILLLLLGTIDFLKIVASGDERNMCVIILILPLFINLVMSTLNVKSYKECYKNATKANIEKLEKAEKQSKSKNNSSAALVIEEISI